MSLYYNEEYNYNKNSNYEKKYIKYKKKYLNLKNSFNHQNQIANKIIILPNEYDKLPTKYKKKFNIYELDKSSKPLSYISNTYPLNTGGYQNITTTTEEEHLQESILEKSTITPDEYFVLSDTNKAKYQIGESDYKKFPNRVVPKNYEKIN